MTGDGGVPEDDKAEPPASPPLDPAIAQTTPPPPEAGSSGTKVWWIVGGVALLCVVAVAIWAVAFRPPQHVAFSGRIPLETSLSEQECEMPDNFDMTITVRSGEAVVASGPVFSEWDGDACFLWWKTPLERAETYEVSLSAAGESIDGPTITDDELAESDFEVDWSMDDFQPTSDGGDVLTDTQTPPGITFAGGDGSSQEEAVVILGGTESTGVHAEYVWIAQNYPGAQRGGQALQHEGDKIYDILTFYTAEGDEMRVYFDITDFYGKF